MATVPQTMFEKVWRLHEVSSETPDTPAVLYIDLHLIHEVTSPQAFSVLRERGLPVRRPDRTVATMDHSISTLPKKLAVLDAQAEKQLETLSKNCAEFGITLYGRESEKQGIV